MDNATLINAASTTVPTPGVWTHLTGVYDAGAGQIRLYVNGVLEATTTVTAAWNTTGVFAARRSKWNGPPATTSAAASTT